MDLDGYRPVVWLPGRHLQTIVPSVWPAPPVPGGAAALEVEVAPSNRVRLLVNRPQQRPRGTVLLVHGMCGSTESSYMKRCATEALSRSWIPVRMNLRNCGGSESLATTLYNAGQSHDVQRVFEHLDELGLPRPFAAVGFSLGGNVVLRFAAVEPGADLVDAVAAINPPIDLEHCAREIERRANRIYQEYYVRRLVGQLRRVALVRPIDGPPPGSIRVRSVRQFDRLYTAPDGGYPSSESYYREASAGPHLQRVRCPALIVSARNDPFVRPEIFARHPGSSRLRLLQPDYGGHCGYWQVDRPRYWVGRVCMDFFENVITR